MQILLLRPVLGSAVDTWATVAVAIGTIGAVGYALFRDLVVTPRRRPNLDLLLEPTGNDRVVVATADGFDAACVRLRVVNRKGRDTADDVVVVVTEVLPQAESEATEARPIGLPLTWAGSNPRLTVGSVHPGSQRHVDLLRVVWPGGDETEIARRWDSPPARLDVAPAPAGGQDALAPGAYEIRVEVRARNADAKRYAIAVVWDGQWSGRAAAWDHLRVEPPDRTR